MIIENQCYRETEYCNVILDLVYDLEDVDNYRYELYTENNPDGDAEPVIFKNQIKALKAFDEDVKYYEDC